MNELCRIGAVGQASSLSPYSSSPGPASDDATPDNRLFMVYYVQGTEVSGKQVSENRLMEIRAGGELGEPVRIAFQKPFTSYFTATVRAGSTPSNVLDLLGHRAGAAQTISYARVRLR